MRRGPPTPPMLERRRGASSVGKGTAVLLLLGGLCAFTTVLTITFGLQHGGFLRTRNVGERPELARIQAQLKTVDICRMEYGHPRKNLPFGRPEEILVWRCSGEGPAQSGPWTVPPSARNDHIYFDMKRSAPTDRFSIQLDESETTVSELAATLTKLTPGVIADASRR